MFSFVLKIFQKEKKKKIHPQLISHIKNISMGLWLHKERKHTYNIQICTSCMWAEISKFTIYTRTQVLAILTQIQAQCNSRSSVVSTGPGREVQMIIYSPVTWQSCECVEWWVLISSAEDVFMQQCSAVTKTSVFASILCQALYTVSVTASLQPLLQERRRTKMSTLKVCVINAVSVINSTEKRYWLWGRKELNYSVFLR